MKRPELSARTVPCLCDLGIFEAAPAGESPDPPRRGGVEVRVSPAALSRGWWSVSGFEPLTLVELRTGAAELPSALWQHLRSRAPTPDSAGKITHSEAVTARAHTHTRVLFT